LHTTIALLLNASAMPLETRSLNKTRLSSRSLRGYIDHNHAAASASLHGCEVSGITSVSFRSGHRTTGTRPTDISIRRAVHGCRFDSPQLRETAFSLLENPDGNLWHYEFWPTSSSSWC